MNATLPYVKMNGIGNSILVVDLRGSGSSLDGVTAEAIGAQPGLHFDQLMAINDPRRAGADAFVDIFNIDGSRAGACGNGTRCVAWVMLRHSEAQRLLIQTAAGDLPCVRIDETTFSVDMGAPGLNWGDIPLRSAVADTRAVLLPDRSSALPAMLTQFSAVSMGNPHAVFFVPDVHGIDLATVGPAIEHNPIFPDRANVSFAEVAGRDNIVLRVWERGAGTTLACGSAACATLVAAVRAGLTERTARVRLPGGDLTIAWREDNHVVMTGAVALEHEGMLPAQLLGRAA